jgi:hypothetical protein
MSQQKSPAVGCGEAHSVWTMHMRVSSLRVSGIYAIPFKAKGFASFLVNDWQLTGVFSYLSGAPGGLDQGEADDADNIQYTGGTIEVGGGFVKIRFNNIDELEGHFERLGFKYEA